MQRIENFMILLPYIRMNRYKPRINFSSETNIRKHPRSLLTSAAYRQPNDAMNFIQYQVT